MEKAELYERMSKAYFQLLTALVPMFEQNSDIEHGLREGMRKFLSNLYIKLNDGDKRKTDYYSEAAKAKIDSGDDTNLVFEHIVPKEKYIQSECVKEAKDKTLTEAKIKERLEKYWKTATITAEEDVKLSSLGFKQKMPDDWEDNAFARYEEAGIKLVEEK